jgi:hypothetical protein
MRHRKAITAAKSDRIPSLLVLIAVFQVVGVNVDVDVQDRCRRHRQARRRRDRHGQRGGDRVVWTRVRVRCGLNSRGGMVNRALLARYCDRVQYGRLDGGRGAGQTGRFTSETPSAGEDA